MPYAPHTAGLCEKWQEVIAEAIKRPQIMQSLLAFARTLLI